MGRPKFGFHTGIAEFERRNCQDRDAYVTASAPVTADGGERGRLPERLRELFHLAVELERAALADDHVSRKLFPNVDCTRASLDCHGHSLTLFTCLFAVGRSAGWVAQWLEALAEPKRRISRPRQVYVGGRGGPTPTSAPASSTAGRTSSELTDSTQDESDFGRFF